MTRIGRLVRIGWWKLRNWRRYPMRLPAPSLMLRGEDAEVNEHGEVIALRNSGWLGRRGDLLSAPGHRPTVKR